MTSTKLQKQLDGLRARRNELHLEREQTSEQLAKAHQAVISGKSTLDASTTLQTKLNTADTTLATIDEQITKLEAQFTEAVEQEAKEKAFAEIATLSRQSLELAKQFEEKLSGFDTFARTFGNELLQLKAQIYQARTAFHQNFEILLPDMGKLSLMYQHYPELEMMRDEIFAELAKRKINLSVLRSEGIFASLHYLDDITAGGYRPPQTAFSWIVWKLLDIAASTEEREPEPQKDEAGEVV